MPGDITPAITTLDEVLIGVSGVRDQLRVLDLGLVVLAVEWAKHHPNDPYPPEHPGWEGEEEQWAFDQLAGKGCASFDDAAVTDFAIAAGLTEHSARKLIRESLMLVHLLPGVWSRVLSGGLDVWRARNLAGDCFDLSQDALNFVDRQMSERTARVTLTTRQRVVAEARQRFMAEEEESAEEAAKNSRTVDFFFHEIHHGVTSVHAELDLPDALALDAAVTAGAQALKDAGSDAPLETRRSWALGDLARSATGQGTLFDGVVMPETCTCTCPAHHGPRFISNHDSPSATGTWVPAHACEDDSAPKSSSRPHWNGKGAAPPGVKLFLHLPGRAFSPTRPSPDPTSAGTGVSTSGESSTANGTAENGTAGKVEGKGIPGAIMCTPETIREWFTRPTLAGSFTPTINVRPTLYRDEEISGDGYQPSERAKEQVHVSHDGCAFPFCIRPAHACDADHTIPWKPDGTGGATCTCNLAPLCRTHHRLKTHGDNAPTANGEHTTWSYTSLGGGEYHWKGPRGAQFIRSNTGTYDVSSELRGGAPAHPSADLTASQKRAVTLGDDDVHEATDNLIDTLLTKASITRGMHNTDLSPMWSVTPQKASNEPPEDWDFDDEFPGGNIWFMSCTHGEDAA